MRQNRKLSGNYPYFHPEKQIQGDSTAEITSRQKVLQSEFGSIWSYLMSS